MNTEINYINENLLQSIDENTYGVIWFTKETINTPTNLHATFDYLLDGKVSKFIEYATSSNIDTKNNNFFITKNFNNPVIIMNSHIETKFSKNDLEDLKMIIKKIDTKADSKLLVIIPHDFKVPEVISKSDFKITSFPY